MPAKLFSASLEFSTSPAKQPQAAEREPRGRFNIIVLGDFSGRTNRGTHESLNARKVRSLDVDNFARVFAQLGATLQLTGAAISDSAVELAFASLDDFHPDQLLAKVPVLTKLAEARRLLLNPATAEQGKAALQAYFGNAIVAPAERAATAAPLTPETDVDTMARLLGGKPLIQPTATPVSALDQFIRRVVAPHVSSAASAWESGAIAVVEMELAQRLNAILHHPDFQALEAAWRGVDLLVRRIESAEEIGLSILDVSMAELQADFAAYERIEQTVLFRLLCDRKCSLIAGNYTFGQDADSLRALGRMAELAATLSSPFVATAAPALVGCDSFALHPDPDDWKVRLAADAAEVLETLRQSAAARFIGLAAPRFLVRQPHGKSGDPIEMFPFEELPGAAAHESFLWGHPAVLCACAAIDAIQAGDTQLAEFTGGEISGLPVHKFTEDAEVVVKSCAEAWLTDRAVARILSCGILPVIPVKNQNAIRLNHLRSVASGPVALAFG